MPKITLYRLDESNTRPRLISALRNDQIVTLNADNLADLPDAKTGVETIGPSIKKHNPENPIPHGERADKPDTGFAGIRYPLNLVFHEDDGIIAKGIDILKTWAYEDSTIDGMFNEGTIGISNEFRPEYDLVPTATSGYQIKTFDVHMDMKFNTTTRATLILEFSGDPAALNTRLN